MDFIKELLYLHHQNILEEVSEGLDEVCSNINV